MTREDYLLQLAEECNELAQVCCKLIRIRVGRSPTPVTESECVEKLKEELADVILTACYVEAHEQLNKADITEIMAVKDKRWSERMSENG